MSRIDSRDLEDFLIKEIPYQAEKDLMFDYLETRLKRDTRNGDYLKGLVKFVSDGLYVLEVARKLRRDPYDHVFDLAAYYGAATLMEDRAASDKLEDREYREAQSMADMAQSIVDAVDDLERESSRGGSSRYRDDRRPSSSGRYSTGGRYQENRYQDDRGSGRYDSRNSRSSGGGRYSPDSRSGRYSSRRNNNGPDLRRGAPDRASERILRSYEERVDSQEQEYEERTPRREERRETREPVRTPDPRRAQGPSRSYEQVEPEDLSRPSNWAKTETRGRLPLPSGKGPVSAQDLRNKTFDFTDIDVIMAVPVSPKDSVRKLGAEVYEVDEVRPEWYVSEIDGYRHLRYIALTDEEKAEVRREIHKLPIVNLEYGDIRVHPQNDQIRSALTRNRYDLEAARNVHNADLKNWEDTVEELRAENLTLPDDQQKELPEDLPATKTPIDQTVKLREVVKGFGMDHIKVIANQRAANMVESMGDNFRGYLRSIQFRAESYKTLFTARSEEEAQAIVQALTLYGISDSFQPTGIGEIYNALAKVVEAVPVPIISAIRRHVVQTINNLFKYEMGTKLAIDTFDDVRTLGDDLIALRGEEFTKLFGKALTDKMINLQLVQAGSGIESVDQELDKRTVYAVIRTEAIIVPLIAKDLSLSKSAEGEESEIFIIDKEGTPRLAKAVSSFMLNRYDHLPVRMMFLLADNNIAEVRNDYIGGRAGVIQLITDPE